MLEVICSKEEFFGLEESWNDLYDRSAGVTPFQSFAFCRESLPLLSGGLHIICWYRKQELMAIFPLYLDRKGTLRFINDRHSDFCGPLMMSQASGDFHMCEAFAEHVRDTSEIRRVRLENMRCDSFQSSLQLQMKSSLLYSYSRYSLFRVVNGGADKSAVDALSQLTVKEKYRLKNIVSKMEKSGVRWKSYDKSAGDAWPERVITELTDSMVESGIRKRKYFSPQYLAFVKGVYESGQMMISVTFDGDKPLSCNLYLKNGEEFIDWMAFYVEPSNNAWNLLQFLDRFHADGGGVLNFARGIYKYKIHNYRPSVYGLDRFHYSKSLMGRTADLLTCMVSEMKRMNRSR